MFGFALSDCGTGNSAKASFAVASLFSYCLVDQTKTTSLGTVNSNGTFSTNANYAATQCSQQRPPENLRCNKKPPKARFVKPTKSMAGSARSGRVKKCGL